MTLRDLTDIQLENPLISESDMGDFKLPRHVIAKLNEDLADKKFHFDTYSGYQYVDSEDNFIIFSNKYLYYIVKMKPFALELFKYVKIVEEQKSIITQVIRDEEVIQKKHTANAIESALLTNENFAKLFDKADIHLLSKFISLKDGSAEDGKNIINHSKARGYHLRGDVFNSVILKKINLSDSSANVFGLLMYAICKNESGLFDFLESSLHEKSDENRIEGGENILFYGAPGTGKSYAANIESKKENAYIVRTLFHPDMQNSDFFGTLKPGVDDKGPTYEFREGPFSKALRHAHRHPAQRVYLIIEELNRAMAAAVFGELFQLLDRDTDGTSEYSVDSPSEEFTEWFGSDKFKLPSNMWILATMNSADQGVYPLDTAFRRRWRQVYIPIEYEIAPEVDVHVATAVGREETVTWRQFVENLNDYLTEVITIPEDRLIGPRFLKESELKDSLLPGKLLIYLWDDLLRHHGRYDLFTETIKTYGDIHKAIKAKKPIFTKAFIETLTFKPSDTQAM